MNNQREVVYTYRNEVIDTDDPHKLVYEVIDEAVPGKVKEYLGTGASSDEPNHAGSAPLGEHHFSAWPNERKSRSSKAARRRRTPQFLIGKIKESYERKSSHEEPTAVKSLERYIILNAIDRLWQEHLYAMDALREGVYLRGYAQKDPLIEYKTEAYDMFVELMANIKNEVLHNLFRSTSNLQAFETFLSTLPAIPHARAGADSTRGSGPVPGRRPERIGSSVSGNGESGDDEWRGGEARARAGPPRIAKSRSKRTLPLREREEIQELLRPGCLTSGEAGDRQPGG